MFRPKLVHPGETHTFEHCHAPLLRSFVGSKDLPLRRNLRPGVPAYCPEYLHKPSQDCNQNQPHPDPVCWQGNQEFLEQI